MEYMVKGRALPHLSADFQGNGPKLLAIAISLLVITFLVLSGRIYCRAVLLKKMGVDDWCMIFAMITGIPLVVTDCIAVSCGLGKHTWMVSIEAKQKIRIMGYIAMIHYFIALGLTKASLLLFLARLSPTSRLATLSWTILGFVVAYTITAFILSAIQCVPASYLWEPLPPSAPPELKAHCLRQRPLQYTLFPINIFTDLIIWLIPLYVIWRVRMPPRQKLALFAIFSLGSMSVLAGILRLGSVEKSLKTTDPVWDNLNLGIWSIVEVFVGIICGSAPAVKPLFSKLLPGLLGNSSLNSYSSSQLPAPPRAFPNSLSRQQTAYALRSIGPVNPNMGGNNSQEEFGPRTQIEGREQKTEHEDEREDFHSSELDLEHDGIFKSTEVQIRFEERV